MDDVGLVTAFLYGMLSFVTPCILPLVPAYITYITGVDLETLQKGGIGRKVIFLNSLLFVMGFSIIFMLLVIPANVVGNLLLQYQVWIQRIAGVIIVVFGLHIAGIINIGILNVEKKLHLTEKPRGYFGSLVIGMTFALGWSPCIGPILASIILIASTQSMSTGVLLLGVYSAGLAIPFLVVGLMIGHFLEYYQGILKHTREIMLVSGLALVFVGGLMILGLFQRFFSVLG
ncbi:MAG: sulfite exporter TauE/SafE family protein [Theionarchaea archaeon]|nr:sulfite exporter TauE/SafE family protein [Theionarchaea archaeon]MBU7037293.1 sulfite exporter TauE/SafE family protein [Theionarchaea archaeon]